VSLSLFVTTNYIPVVNETDHGTWRRFALVVFPFTFRKPAEPLSGPTDRRGDPGLKARLRGGAACVPSRREAHSGLAWRFGGRVQERRLPWSHPARLSSNRGPQS
jgi:hypothetical protein